MQSAVNASPVNAESADLSVINRRSIGHQSAVPLKVVKVFGVQSARQSVHQSAQESSEKSAQPYAHKTGGGRRRQVLPLLKDVHIPPV